MGHMPDITRRLVYVIFLEMFSSRPNVRSATDWVVAAGTLVTVTWCAAAAATAMLSTPMPIFCATTSWDAA